MERKLNQTPINTYCVKDERRTGDIVFSKFSKIVSSACADTEAEYI